MPIEHLATTPARTQQSDYTYAGIDKDSGLYVFEQDGKRELFRRTKDKPASWCLQIGAFYFEFVRSAQ